MPHKSESAPEAVAAQSVQNTAAHSQHPPTATAPAYRTSVQDPQSAALGQLPQAAQAAAPDQRAKREFEQATALAVQTMTKYCPEVSAALSSNDYCYLPTTTITSRSANLCLDPYLGSLYGYIENFLFWKC